MKHGERGIQAPLPKPFSRRHNRGWAKLLPQTAVSDLREHHTDVL
jgi:hypothetical protein